MLAHPVSSASSTDSGIASGPSDLAAVELHRQHEVDGAVHHRPHRLGECAVPGDEHVVPHAGGDVGAEVAVAVGILDDAVAQLDRPRAVRALRVAAPVERRPRRLPQPRDRQRHRVLDVIPRVGVAAVEPGQRAGGFLRRRDRLRGLEALLRRQDAGDTGDLMRPQRHRLPKSAGFWKYRATLLPISGFSAASASRVSHGCDIMSHTSSL